MIVLYILMILVGFFIGHLWGPGTRDNSGRTRDSWASYSLLFVSMILMVVGVILIFATFMDKNLNHLD